MKQGLRCLVGNGNDINIFSDGWLSSHPPRFPQLRTGVDTNLQKVHELLQLFQVIIDNYNNHQRSDLMRQLPLWILWKSRNLLLYQKQSSSWQKDLMIAEKEAQEWITCCQSMSHHTSPDFFQHVLLEKTKTRVHQMQL